MGAAPVMFVNPREGKYPQQACMRARSLPRDGGHCGAGLQQRRVDGYCRDACGRAGIDAVAQCGGAGHVGRRFERVELPLKDAMRGWGVTAIDIDNDGWIDLAAIVETNAGPQVKVFRNRGDGSFEDVSHALGLDS